MNDKPTTVRLDDTQAKALKLVADARGTNLSIEIREAIHARLNELRQDEEFQEALAETMERFQSLFDALSDS
jgi:predicted DNA-binding protein